jgi:hypothetical protein
MQSASPTENGARSSEEEEEQRGPAHGNNMAADKDISKHRISYPSVKTHNHNQSVHSYGHTTVAVHDEAPEWMLQLSMPLYVPDTCSPDGNPNAALFSQIVTRSPIKESLGMLSHVSIGLSKMARSPDTTSSDASSMRVRAAFVYTKRSAPTVLSTGHCSNVSALLLEMSSKPCTRVRYGAGSIVTVVD